MKVNMRKNGDGTVTLECVATAQEVDGALQSAHLGFANAMGLQPEAGKTVSQVAEEKMGIKNLDSVVESSAIDALVPFALDRKNLIPAYPPQAEAKSPFKRGRDFRFQLDVMLKPEFELTSYDPVEITVAPFSIDEAAVEAQFEELSKRYTYYEATDAHPVGKGDSCLISMKSFKDGEPMEALTTDGRTYTAGEGLMPEGFDEQIIGMSPGETKTFTFEGPSFDEDFNEITETIETTVTVIEIQKELEPVIDDAWVAKNLPMYKGVEALRADISRSIERRDREQYEAYRRQVAAAELAKRFEGKIADEIYEAMRGNLLESLRAELRAQDKTWEQFIDENGGEQQAGMMLMMQTRELLVQGFALDAIFRHEHLSLDDHDIEAACRSMNPNMNPRQMRQQLEQSGRGFALRESAERLKANQWVLDHAIVHERE